MRRPSFCCDHDKSSPQPPCPYQGGGTLARVRRFLSISLGRRHHHGSSSSCSSRHQFRKGSPARHSDHCPLNQLVAQATNILGLPLDQVMTRQGDDHGLGVPVLVHVLCCYMLSHGVDHDALVDDDWMVDEARVRLVNNSDQGPNYSLKDHDSAAAAAGLLRLFLHDLPHPLMHAQWMQNLLSMCQELNRESCRDLQETIGGRIWSFLSHRLTSHNLNLMSYLSAFLYQLHATNSNTSQNTCSVTSSSLGRVLGRVLVGRTATRGDLNTATQIAELLIVHYTYVFHNGDVSVVSSPESEAEDSPRTEDEPVSPSEPGENDNEDDDDDTTTTTDTDDFRSLPVSPIKSVYADLPLDPPSPLDNTFSNLNDPDSPGWGRLSPTRAWEQQITHQRNMERAGDSTGRHGCSGRGRGHCRAISWLKNTTQDSERENLVLDPASPAAQDPAVGTVIAQHPSARDIPPRDPAAPSPSPSATDADVAGVAALPAHQRKRKEHNTEGDSEHDPKVIRSNNELLRNDDINSANKAYCETFVTQLSDGITDNSSKDDDDDEEEEQSSQYLQDTNLKFHSSEEEGKLTEEDDYAESQEDNDYANESSQNETKESSGPLSELLAYNEPVTTSDRGSWGLRRDMSHYDSWHRTAHHYNRFEEPTELPSSPWYNSPDDPPVTSRSYRDHSPVPMEEDHFSSSGQSANRILTKNINSIKRKIKKFEEEFEAAFGYRPSHSDKMKHKDIKKYMSELSRARKELKQLKEDVTGIVSSRSVFPLSLLRCQESTQNSNTAQPTTFNLQQNESTADTIRQVEERLREKRNASGRPDKLSDMTSVEIQDEKTALQKALLYYESLHGRPSTREDRDLARPLYDRYRLVKRSVVRTNSRKDNLLELAPILEHEAMDFTLASPQHRSSLQETESSFAVEEKETLSQEQQNTTDSYDTDDDQENISLSDDSIGTLGTSSNDLLGRQAISLGGLHSLPLFELRERKKEARDDKKRLRRALREYEEKFERDTSRKVQKEDRGPMEPIYIEYKHAKAKLRLLEALISKQERCKF